MDLFLDSAAHTTLVSCGGHKPVNDLLATYSIQERAREVFTGAILEEGAPSVGAGVWEACEAAGDELWVLWPMCESDLMPPAARERFDTKEVLSITLSGHFRAPIHHMWILAPHDAGSFRTLMSYFGDTEIVGAVPAGSDLNKLKTLLEAMQSPSSQSDLTQVNRILEAVPWFYAVRRNHQDWPYSLFVARDNSRVRRVAEGDRSGPTRLIACF